MKTFRKTSGFTLVELLITIGIIGVLASIVLSSLQEIRMKGRDTKRQADLRALVSAMALCYDDDACGATPTGKDYWTCPGTNSLDTTTPCDGTSGGVATGWNFSISPYLTIISRDPVNTGSFIYTWHNNGIEYGGSSSESAGQWYCISAVSESNSGMYYLANPRGVRAILTLPTDSNCLEL